MADAPTNSSSLPDGVASAILDSIADGVYALDRQFRFTLFNDRCESYFGLRREEVLGRSYFEVFPVAGGSDLEASLVESMESGEVRQIETVSKITGIPILLRAFPSASGLTVVFTDVSERYRGELERSRLEAERIKQLETFDAVLAPLQEYVFLLDPEGRCRYANKPLLNLWGVSLAESIGKDFDELGYPTTLAETLRRQIRQTVETGKKVEGEADFTNRFGEAGQYEYAFVPIFGADGEVEAVGGHTRIVTERRKREAEMARLPESSERQRRLYDTILSNTPDLAYVWGLDHRFVYANAALLGMWGKTWDEAIGKHCLELGYEPWHAEMHDREIEQVIATRQPVRGVVPFNGAYGRRMYDYILVPVLGEDGNVEAVAGTTRDVTDLIEAEAALRRSEERFRKALEIETVGVLFFLLDGTILDANAAFQRMSGWSIDRLRTIAHWSELTTPEHMPVTQEAAGNLARSGKTRPYEKQLVRPDGSHWWGLFAPTRLTGSGENSECVEYVVDISEVKRAESALRESEEQLRTVFQEATDDAILLMDEDRRLLAWNSGAERICGWTAEEALGRRGDMIFTPEDQANGVPEREAQNAAEVGKVPNERWHVRKDGRLFWGSGSMNVLCNQDGAVRGFLKVFRDATARYEVERKAEEIRADLERMVAERTLALQEAVREAEGFNYSIAHDLRSPVRAIVSTSSILLEEAGPQLSEVHREMLDRQAYNAKRLGTLIDELLRLSRLARAQVRRQPLDISRKAREVAAVESADRLCRVEVQEGMTAEGDPDLVRTLLHNLIGNACKFSPDGGVVRVGQTGDVFWVKDEGVGFDMAYAEKLFLPFERLVREDEFPGTGIGLANVERIVRRHGGRVWAESEGPGKGATFYLTLGQTAPD